MSSSSSQLSVSSSSTAVNVAAVNDLLGTNYAQFIETGSYVPIACTTCGHKHESGPHFFQYVHEDSLYEEMKDPVTLEPFIDPVVLRSDRCQHTFSRVSIEDAINAGGCCPIDNAPLTLDDIMGAPLLVKNLLNGMLVCCPNAGCEEILQRGELEKHLTECPGTHLSCQRTAEGRTCEAVVRRGDLATHDLECGSRQVKCEVEGGCELMMAGAAVARHDCVQSLKKRILELEGELRASKTFRLQEAEMPRFLRSWGRYGVGDGEFESLLGVAVCSRTNEVYTLDHGLCRVQVFDERGNFLRKWGMWGTRNGRFVGATDIALSQNGEVYVVDGGNNRVQVFDPTGTFLRRFGKKGSSPGALDSPCSVAISSGGEVYVTDTGNGRIQVYDLEGHLLRKWDIPGDEHSSHSFPGCIALSSLDEVYVGVGTSHRIQVFDRLGKLLRQFGPQGVGQRYMSYPREIVITAKNEVCVADEYAVRVFDSAGNFLRDFSSDKLEGPRELAFCNSTGHIYVTDPACHQIRVYR